MRDIETYSSIPPEGINTPNGYLYYPPALGKQILFLVAAFFSAILLGWLICKIVGNLSDFASGVIYFVFLLIFFLGYGLWLGSVHALVFSRIKWPLIKMAVKFFVWKEKPFSVKEFLPEREKLIEMMVRVQKFSRAFLIISWPIGILGSFATLFMSSSLNSSILFLLVFVTSVLYGYLLSYFGRRGYLPLPEE
jgi:hypothetical protein